jgi:hypothetical protein
MSLKLYSTLPDVRAVPGASQTGPLRVNIPCVGRIHNIKAIITKTGGSPALATLDEMRAAIGEVRLILDTYVWRRWTLGEYFSMLETNGYLLAAGRFAYFFSEPWRATVTDEEKLALALGGRYTQAALEMDVTQGASPLAFTFAYELDYLDKVVPAGFPNAGAPLKGIIGQSVQVENVGGGDPIIMLDKLDAPIQRLYIKAPAAVNIDRVTLLTGDTVIYDRWNTALRPELARQLKDMGLAIPTNYTDANGTFKTIPVIFDNNQQTRISLPTGGNLRLQLKLSAAAQLRLLLETRVAA